jgi:hypothetical protein
VPRQFPTGTRSLDSSSDGCVGSRRTCTPLPTARGSLRSPRVWDRPRHRLAPHPSRLTLDGLTGESQLPGNPPPRPAPGYPASAHNSQAPERFTDSLQHHPGPLTIGEVSQMHFGLQHHPARVHQMVASAAVCLLGSVVSTDPSFPVVLTDWLS